MSAEILDGQATARAVRAEVKERVSALKRATGVTPVLAAVVDGQNPAMQAYVGMKGKACGWVGIRSATYALGPDATQQEAEALIDRLNADPATHGVLIQHPLAPHLDESAILGRLRPGKDVDGITQASLGALLTGQTGFVSCTPAGIIELMDRYGLPIQGKGAVVVGRSIILGKPVALLLLGRHATVTICHTRTRDLAEVTRRADILVAAVGKAEMITGDMVKPGAVVIDAGYNHVPGRQGDVGDVEYGSASRAAGWITPVPGGVGPMTIAMLLRNTVAAAEAAV